MKGFAPQTMSAGSATIIMYANECIENIYIVNIVNRYIVNIVKRTAPIMIKMISMIVLMMTMILNLKLIMTTMILNMKLMMVMMMRNIDDIQQRRTHPTGLHTSAWESNSNWCSLHFLNNDDFVSVDTMR